MKNAVDFVSRASYPAQHFESCTPQHLSVALAVFADASNVLHNTWLAFFFFF